LVENKKLRNKFYLFLVLNNILINLINGDWGLGIGDWGLRPPPHPQSPITNPQSPIPNPLEKFKISK